MVLGQLCVPDKVVSTNHVINNLSGIASAIFSSHGSGLRVIFSSGTFGDLVEVCLAILFIFLVRVYQLCDPNYFNKLSTALFELRQV